MMPELVMFIVGAVITTVGFSYGYHRGWQDGQADLREQIYEILEGDGR